MPKPHELYSYERRIHLAVRWQDYNGKRIRPRKHAEPFVPRDVDYALSTTVENGQWRRVPGRELAQYCEDHLAEIMGECGDRPTIFEWSDKLIWRENLYRYQDAPWIRLGKNAPARDPDYAQKFTLFTPDPATNYDIVHGNHESIAAWHTIPGADLLRHYREHLKDVYAIFSPGQKQEWLETRARRDDAKAAREEAQIREIEERAQAERDYVQSLEEAVRLHPELTALDDEQIAAVVAMLLSMRDALRPRVVSIADTMKGMLNR